MHTLINYKFFDKKPGVNKLHKPITRKFQRCNIYLSYQDSNCGADLADGKLISKSNVGVRLLLCVIDICNNYEFIHFLHTEKVFQSLMYLKNSWMSLGINQLRYGQIREVIFTVYGCMKMALKCIQHKMKGILLLLRDLSQR